MFPENLDSWLKMKEVIYLYAEATALWISENSKILSNYCPRGRVSARRVTTMASNHVSAGLSASVRFKERACYSPCGSHNLDKSKRERAHVGFKGQAEVDCPALF